MILLLCWLVTTTILPLLQLINVLQQQDIAYQLQNKAYLLNEMDLESVNLNDLPDAEIAERMRKFNYEKFKTLVRMHLSFELELNTDEFDLPCHEIVYEDKGKLKKWNRMSKKQRHNNVGGSLTGGCAASSKASVSANSSPTEGLQQQIDAGFMFHLQELKQFLLEDKNITQEGIFRKTGSTSRQNELRLQIQSDKPLELEASGYSTHDCATVFKGYLAELPEPLLTDAHYPAHLQIAPLCISAPLNSNAASNSTLTRPPNPERAKREQHLLCSVQLLLLLLPEENRHLLQHIVEMLHAIAAQQQHNKMTAENLATLFAPHLICPRKLPPEALHYLAKKLYSIITYMIIRGADIFQVPAKLSTDIRAYFLERKRKKTMSPEQTLDDSISDISTVNTVYTFVDREKTAAAHTTNTTDTELAQLYAHIQSLPESSKKRRLIKQFNKQNGQGTPLQLVIMNRLKNSEASRSAKSISDSIKKHIFHKGIMSRTPKRSAAAAVPSGLETPIMSNTKNPKLRVLFQSPAPAYCNVTTFTTTTTLTTTASSSSSSSSSSNYLTTNSNTPYAIKTHPLQKSISSSSLLLANNTPTTLTRHSKRYCMTPHTDEIDSASPSCSTTSSSSNSSDDFGQQPLTCSVSAPVSRQVSHELSANNSTSAPASLAYVNNSANTSSTSMTAAQSLPLLDAACCVTPLKLITEAAKHLIATEAGAEKKTVAWHDDHLLAKDEISNPCTPMQEQNARRDLKARYKSEPNLSHLHKEKINDVGTSAKTSTTTMTKTLQNNETVTPSMKSKSLTRKLLMKGVSMSNLRFPFSTPETTRRLVRSVSSTLKRRASDEPHFYVHGPANADVDLIGVTPLLEDVDDLDDETFEDAADDDIESVNSDNMANEEHDVDDDAAVRAQIVRQINYESSSSCSSELPGCSALLNDARSAAATSYQHLLLQQGSGVYRNLDLITSTPSSLLLGRRSMSPITKSAQRMPKAMQESIMTPRSRKPVMVLTTTTHSSGEQNQTLCQADLSSCREQDEEEFMDQGQHENAGGYALMLRRQHLLQANQSYLQENSFAATSSTTAKNQEEPAATTTTEELTNNFKEYLLTRSVLTATPEDSSFSSQPGDFGSTQDIGDLDESQLSPSLLYCLDGNQPADKSAADPLHNVNDNATSLEGSRSPINYFASNPFVIHNNARKRAATNDLEDKQFTAATTSTTSTQASSTALHTSDNTLSTSSLTTSTSLCQHNTNAANKENYNDNVDDYFMSKKLLISEYPGETSF